MIALSVPLTDKLRVMPSGCVEYTGSVDRYGYGKHGGRSLKAHRVAYRLFRGEIPEGMLVCHSCDNRLCCNPEHLFLGSPRDNTHDMIRKGRASFANAITERQARIVKSLLVADFTAYSAAKIAGVKYSVAKLIKRGKAWAYIPALEP